LRQLKKRLKKQQRDPAKKSSSQLRNWGLLALLALAAASLPVYQHFRQAAPQRLFRAALKLESQGAIGAAHQLYQQLYQDYPAAEQAPEALLRTGRLWQLDRRHDQQALLSFLQLEHDFPASELVLSAREEAAGIVKSSLRDYSRAIELYQRLLDEATDKVDWYLYEIADCYFRLDNYTQSRIELDTLLERVPLSPLRPEVLYRRGGLHLLEKRLAAAREDWQQLIEDYPLSIYTPQARFNLAKLLEEEDRLAEALEQYRRLTDYPQPALLEEKIDHLERRIQTKKKAL